MGLITIPSSSSLGLFSARMTASQSVAANTAVTAIFDGELFDTRNQYNNSTGVFTCSVAGYWQFNTSLRLTSTAAITNAILQATHNSVVYRSQQIIDPSSTVTTFGLSSSFILLLSPGDTVSIQGFIGTTGTASYQFLTAGLFSSVFSGHLIAAT